jgi:hypothetical protein
VRAILYLALFVLIAVSIITLTILKNSNNMANTLYSVQSRFIFKLLNKFLIKKKFDLPIIRGMTIMNSMVYMSRSAAQQYIATYVPAI